MITALSALILIGVVFVVVMAAVMGWGERVTRCQRVGLIVCASGLTLAAPARYLSQPVGVADLIWIVGLFVYLLARHGKHILRRADRLDGHEDGRQPPREISKRRD